jgi:hypothetical protein
MCTYIGVGSLSLLITSRLKNHSTPNDLIMLGSTITLGPLACALQWMKKALGQRHSQNVGPRPSLIPHFGKNPIIGQDLGQLRKKV